MKKTPESLFGLLAAAVLLALGSGTAVAGGLVDTSSDVFDAADFTTNPSADITNPWWTLPAGDNFLYFSETEDGCEWNLVEVLPATTNNFMGGYAGKDARIILDRAWLDDTCLYGDADDPDEIEGNFADVWTNSLGPEEQTYDWFAQDKKGNIWYMGEDTFNGDDHSGSFTAGCDGAEAGIVVLGEPAKGDFYKQEFFEDEAEDFGKVLNFIKMDGLVCMKAKEWSPLEHGHIEHKFYCHDNPAGPGELLLIHELQGGTVVQELVATNVAAPPGPTLDINMIPVCPPYTGP